MLTVGDIVFPVKRSRRKVKTVAKGKPSKGTPKDRRLKRNRRKR